MSTNAPILIPTLNRFEHFQNCVESLSICTEATSTDLFIALDYPKTENHCAGYRKIRDYIKVIRGFKTVTIIERNINYGPERNLFEAITEIFNNYDRLILSEDDNIFSPDFLHFINYGLDVYKDRQDIFSVSGYNYPIEPVSSGIEPAYLWTGFSAWGVGIWKNKWNQLDFSRENVMNKVGQFLANLNKVRKLNKVANHYIPGLVNMLKKGKVHADGFICMHLFLKNMYSVFPYESRVRNMGNDGSGINCGNIENDRYKLQPLYTGSKRYELFIDLRPDSNTNTALSRHFRQKLRSRIKLIIQLLLIKVQDPVKVKTTN